MDENKVKFPLSEMTQEDAAKLTIPYRICGDIPFLEYLQYCRRTPKRYLEFLKELRKSKSRHDILFWYYDILCAGRSNHIFAVPSLLLDNCAPRFFDDFMSVLKNASKVLDATYSLYLIREYPWITDVTYGEALQRYKRRETFDLCTYESKDPDLYRYRHKELFKFGKPKKEKIRGVGKDEKYLIHPMKYFDVVKLEDSEEDQDDVATENAMLVFRFAPYGQRVFTYTGTIPNTSKCMLFINNPYKKAQAEIRMRKIQTDDLLPFFIDFETAYRFCKEGTICYVRYNIPSYPKEYETSNYEEYEYKCAQIFINPDTPPSEEILVCLLDYGKCEYVPLYSIFLFDFKIRKEQLATKIVSRNELAEDLQIGDFYSRPDFATDDKKYLYFGRPSKQSDSFFGKNSAPLIYST